MSCLDATNYEFRQKWQEMEEENKIEDIRTRDGKK